MEMDVRDARKGLPPQTRSIEVVDVARLAIKDVEHVEIESPARAETIAYAAVDERRRLRTRRTFLDERAARNDALAGSLTRGPGL